MQQNDFVNLNEFNKYLQEKEDLVFDFDEFKINEFKLKNKEIIKQNQLILLKKDLFEKSKINQEILIKNTKKEKYINLLKLQTIKKRREREEGFLIFLF